MTIHVNIGEAKARFSELCSAALHGEEVILQRAGVPKLKLVPIARAADQERDARNVKLRAILAEIDQIPDRPDAFNPLEWDEHGLSA